MYSVDSYSPISDSENINLKGLSILFNHFCSVSHLHTNFKYQFRNEFLIIYDNIKYNDNNYKYRNQNKFYSRIIIERNSTLNKCTIENYLNGFYSNYTETFTEIGFTNSFNDILICDIDYNNNNKGFLIYETNSGVKKYGYITIINSTTPEYAKLRLTYYDNDSQEYKNVNVYSWLSQNSWGHQPYGAIHIRNLDYDYNSIDVFNNGEYKDDNYINKILINDYNKSDDNYYPIFISYDNYCKYLYNNSSNKIDYERLKGSKYYFYYLYQLNIYGNDLKFNYAINCFDKYIQIGEDKIAKEFKLLYLDKNNKCILTIEFKYNDSSNIFECNIFKQYYYDDEVKKISNTNGESEEPIEFKWKAEIIGNLESINLYLNNYQYTDQDTGQNSNLYNEFKTFTIESNIENHKLIYIYNNNTNKNNNCLSFFQFISNLNYSIIDTNPDRPLSFLSLMVKRSNTITSGNYLGWFSNLIKNDNDGYKILTLDNGSSSSLVYNNGKYGIKQILIRDFNININDYNEEKYTNNIFISGLDFSLDNSSRYIDNDLILRNENIIYVCYIYYNNIDCNEQRHVLFVFTNNYGSLYFNNGRIIRIYSNIFQRIPFEIHSNRISFELESFDKNLYYNYFFPFDCKPNISYKEDTEKCYIEFDLKYLAIYDKRYDSSKFNLKENFIDPHTLFLYNHMYNVQINEDKIDNIIEGKFYIVRRIDEIINNVTIINYNIIYELEFTKESKIVLKQIEYKETTNENNQIIYKNDVINEYEYISAKKISYQDNNNNNKVYLELKFENGEIRFYDNKVVSFCSELVNEVELDIKVAYPYEYPTNTNFEYLALNNDDYLYCTTKNESIELIDDYSEQKYLITNDLVNYINKFNDDSNNYIRIYIKNKYIPLFSITFYKDNTVKLNSFVVNDILDQNNNITGHKINDYIGGTFYYEFENLYNDFNLSNDNDNNSIDIKDYYNHDITVIMLYKNKIRIYMNHGFCIFNLMLLNGINFSNYYILNTEYTTYEDIDYYSTSTSLKEKPFYVKDLIQSDEVFNLKLDGNQINNIIDTLKLNNVVPYEYKNYRFSKISSYYDLIDFDQTDQIYIGFIQFKSNKVNNDVYNYGYSPIVRYRRISYCFRSTDNYFFDNVNRFDYLYQLSSQINLVHDLVNRVLKRGDNYDHFLDGTNYIVPFDSEPIKVLYTSEFNNYKENDSTYYCNRISNYGIIEFITSNNVLSFYSNVQLDYNENIDDEEYLLDNYTTLNIDNFIEIKNKLDKISRIYVVYILNGKIFRDLYLLSLNSKDPIEYYINYYIINYNTQNESVVKLNKELTINYSSNTLGIIIGGLNFYYDYDSDSISMEYSNYTYNRADNTNIIKEVKIIQFKLKDN